MIKGSLTLQPGDDPSIGYCRICGGLGTPPYEGYYRDSVCSPVCMAEFKWRETLRIMRKTYYVHGTKGVQCGCVVANQPSRELCGSTRCICRCHAI